MVKTSHFHCRGFEVIPGQGTKSLQVIWCGKKSPKTKYKAARQEKMLASWIITEMRIKTTMRYYLTQSECPSSKDLQTINAGEGEEKRNLHSWWECKLMQSLWRTVWSFLKKPKIELPYDPAIPLLDIYTEKTLIQKDTCTPLFIVALFTIAKVWKQHKCSSTDKWAKKMYIGNSLTI